MHQQKNTVARASSPFALRKILVENFNTELGVGVSLHSSSTEGRRRFQLSPLSASFHSECYSHGGRCSWLSPCVNLCLELAIIARGRHGLSSAAVAATPSSTRGRPPRKHGTLISSRIHPYATSVILPRCMEASARGLVLGSPHNPVQLQPSVLIQPPCIDGFILLW